MARLRARAGTTQLSGGWETAATAPGAVPDPAALAEATLAWQAAPVPGTAASALRFAGTWKLGDARDFDAQDWWFRTSFEAGAGAAEDGATTLNLRGLATVADVWVNGVAVLASDNMFHEHVVDVSTVLAPGGSNELVIRCRALAPLLAARRPRPRWKTRLCDPQNLRFFRTTLLGRIPGWTPKTTAVGPWRPVIVEKHARFVVEATDICAAVDGSTGTVHARLVVRALDGQAPHAARLRVGDVDAPLATTAGARAGVLILEGHLRIVDVALWWPHTHGSQPLYAVNVTIDETVFDAAPIGFRTITLDTSNGGFAISVNGVSVFCRGACWTTTDIVTLAGTEADYAHALDLARDAGMNMLRVGGTMHYEEDAFYEGCDARGILVWQDFMFANMDYPGADEAFAESVHREVSTFVSRVQTCPCVAVFCGNSEIEQQAAMLGLPREAWKSPLFDELIPNAARALRPDVPYFPSSPSGGVLPFQADAGATHYYGVGAYLRPLDDARRANVRFASECLAFANVPEEPTIEALLGDGQVPHHHPVWKARVPRDNGSGWDFEDVRDHYVARLFDVDPMRIRYSDMNRYLALGRVAVGEVMASTIGEWRRAASTCNGALIFFYQDLWPGAGWGIVDSFARPKSAYFYVKRAMAKVALVASDEGVNGIVLHAINDTPEAIEADVQLALYRRGETKVASGSQPVTVPAHASVEVRGDALFEHFLDTTYAYKFGPPGHDLAVGALVSRATGERLAEAFFFPLGFAAMRGGDPSITATADVDPVTGEVAVTMQSSRFAHAVAIEARGFEPDDNYVHLEPNVPRLVTLRRAVNTSTTAAPKPFQGALTALNAAASTKIVVVARAVADTNMPTKESPR